MVGATIGDALAMPIHGLSHQNVRMYYKGIKGYQADEKRGGAAGTGTLHTRRLRCAARTLREGTWPDDCLDNLPRDTADAAVVAIALAGHEAAEALLTPLHLAPDAHAAAATHAWAVAHLCAASPETFDPAAFWAALRARTARAEMDAAGTTTRLTSRLYALTPALDEYPLDLQERCNGTGDAPDEAWPFAVAMFTRNPFLVEATLLSAINVGGAAATVGALVGSLLGALHGAAAFPQDWRDGLEPVGV